MKWREQVASEFRPPSNDVSVFIAAASGMSEKAAWVAACLPVVDWTELDLPRVGWVSQVRLLDCSRLSPLKYRGMEGLGCQISRAPGNDPNGVNKPWNVAA